MKRVIFFQKGLISIMLLIVLGLSSRAATYYVKPAANGGNDNNTGLSDARAWATVSKVNSYSLNAGDTVYFKCGSTWREQLVPQSGTSGNPVTYGAYRNGNKPLFLGSESKSNPGDWTDLGNNLWRAVASNTVRNLIFNGRTSAGKRYLDIADVDEQGEYYIANNVVTLYSVSNPGNYYSDIEVVRAMTTTINRSDDLIYIVGNSHDIVIDSLDISCAGRIGISNSNGVYNITIRNCDISWIGIAKRNVVNGKEFGIGNGLQFWNDAHDCVVERCKIWECFDAGITNQGNNQTNSEYNLYFRNNIIWNCEYSYEFWVNTNWGIQTFKDIYFENNTCIDAGYGWGHDQRDDPSGTHLMCFDGNQRIPGSYYIRNNIFSGAKRSCAIIMQAWFNVMDMDYNCWDQESGLLIGFSKYNNEGYSVNEFSTYQSETGQDVHSFLDAPLVKDAPNHDFHLTQESPCINTGTSVDTGNDYDGNSRPQGSSFDIGAFEFSLNTGASQLLNGQEGLNMSVYPNPSATGSATVAYELPAAMDVSIYILDEMGNTKKILKYRRQSEGIYQEQVNTVNYAPGLYFCKLVTGDGMIVQKFIVT